MCELSTSCDSDVTFVVMTQLSTDTNNDRDLLMGVLLQLLAFIVEFCPCKADDRRTIKSADLSPHFIGRFSR